MDCSSLLPFSLYSRTESHNLSRLSFKSKPGFLVFIKTHSTLSINPTHSHKFSSHPTTHPQSLSHNSSKFFTSPLKPTINSQISFQFFEKAKTNFLKPISEKLAILIFGSVLFMTRISCKPALALQSDMPSAILSGVIGPLSGEVDETAEKEHEYLRKLEKNPRHVDALRSILFLKMGEGNTEEALEYVEKLIEIEPNEVEWRIVQAFTYQMTGQLNEAKKLFKDILEGNPTSLRLLHGLAMVMHKNHENSSVFQMLDKALEVARCEKRVAEERNIRILIAQMHLLKGYTEMGSKMYQDLFQENPRDFRPHLFQVLHESRVTNWTRCDDYIINYLLKIC